VTVGLQAAGPQVAQMGRYPRLSLMCLIFSVIVCSVSMAWLNKAQAFTVLSHTLGWLVGLSVLGVLLSLGLLTVYLARRGWQVGWAWVPIWSISYLAFVPFLRIAIRRRRPRDWAVFAAYLSAVGAGIALAVSGTQGSYAWSIAYLLIPLVAGTAAVHALSADGPAARELVMDAPASYDWQQDSGVSS
jgi:hypothetical protein